MLLCNLRFYFHSVSNNTANQPLNTDHTNLYNFRSLWVIWWQTLCYQFMFMAKIIPKIPTYDTM